MTGNPSWEQLKFLHRFERVGQKIMYATGLAGIPLVAYLALFYGWGSAWFAMVMAILFVHISDKNWFEIEVSITYKEKP